MNFVINIEKVVPCYTFYFWFVIKCIFVIKYVDGQKVVSYILAKREQKNDQRMLMFLCLATYYIFPSRRHHISKLT